MLAYNKATGWTPSGAPLVDDSERVARAYEAIYALLEKSTTEQREADERAETFARRLRHDPTVVYDRTPATDN
jgi:hypothetical protein